MAKDMTTFPVTKGGKFFGYADAGQIARSKGVLEVFDPAKAAAIEATKEVSKASSDEAKKAKGVEAAVKAGGADAAAVKKGPSS